MPVRGAPAGGAADAVIVLGGGMHPDEDERHGWLGRSSASSQGQLERARRSSASASARS